MDYKRLKDDHRLFKEGSLNGRYITMPMIEPLLKRRKNGRGTSDMLGHSVKGRLIYGFKLGSGSLKVLAWSQMHGNESTTTKAVMDLINYLDINESHDLLKEISLYLVPILNPDGAETYARLNANHVDLNRDAQQLTQPESRILHQLYMDFEPDYCLNLHGQRTIFGVGKDPRSAVLSFLSPAQDVSRKNTPSRKKGMAIISTVSTMLQEFIPGSVGRYDDSFNINCVGDTLQARGIPTILFEAGHLNGDYEREQVRTLVFIALIKALEAIAYAPDKAISPASYSQIPENRKCFYDHILRNIKLKDRGVTEVAVHYKEELKGRQVHFAPLIEKIGGLENFKGHKEWDCNGESVAQEELLDWSIGSKMEEIRLANGKTITFSLNLPKIL